MTHYEEISATIDSMLEGLTGEEVVEIGVGLVARGVFRTAGSKGHAEAANEAGSASSVISGMHIDMLRRAAAVQSEGVE